MRGRCLSLLTNGPFLRSNRYYIIPDLKKQPLFEKTFSRNGAGSCGTPRRDRRVCRNGLKQAGGGASRKDRWISAYGLPRLSERFGGAAAAGSLLFLWADQKRDRRGFHNKTPGDRIKSRGVDRSAEETCLAFSRPERQHHGDRDRAADDEDAADQERGKQRPADRHPALPLGQRLGRGRGRLASVASASRQAAEKRRGGILHRTHIGDGPAVVLKRFLRLLRHRLWAPR